MAIQSTDGRRLRGERTRHSILEHAARVGSAEEFDSRPGPVRDSVLEKKAYWSYSIERSVREAQEAGEVDRDVDPEQLAWELDSLLGGVNSGFKGGDGQRAVERGRRAIRDRLNRAATPAAKPLT